MARLLGPLILLLGALVLSAASAAGQSLLSETPPAWLATEVTAGAASEISAIPDAPPPGLFTLLDMVDRGEGAQAYPFLLAIFEQRRLPGFLGPEYQADARARVIEALLRAGEGIASPQQQEAVARAYVEEFPDGPFFPEAFFYLNRALERQNRPLEESFFFDQAALESLPAWMQSRYLIMQSESAERRGEFARAAAFRLAELTSATALRESTRAQVLALLGRMPSLEALRAFLDSQESWLQEQWPFLAVRVLIHGGQLNEAYLALDRMEREGQAESGAALKFVRDARTDIEQAILTRPERIGVLLPLSSTNAALRELARDVLDGLRMAVQFRGPPEPPLARLGALVNQDLDPGMEPAQPRTTALPFELVVKDSGNSAERATRMVEELAERDRVIAIIGPVARGESQGALQRAEEIGIPLISLSITATLPPGTRFGFRHNKSQEEELRDLARYAMDYLGARRFAILYPRNNYGEEMLTGFWEEVSVRDGEVVGVGSFQPSGTDDSRAAAGLQAVFESLAGVDRFVTAEDKTLIERAGDKKPDPVVQFDALFLPIHARGGQDLRQIAPYPATINAEKAAVLGSRNWNSDTVIVATAGKLDGAVFVDSYYREGTGEAQQAFRARHRLLFNHRPDYQAPSFYTALAYDTVGMLMELLAQPQNRSRERLAKALREMEPYAGLTGLTTFAEPGYAIKESMLLRLQGDRMVRVFP
jgi:ABC-type branched-subunit amino acid transport system substrate-binding protein